MSENNVIPLFPDTYVVSIDVYLVLPLITASIWLNFGPFTSEVDAVEWLNMVEVVHVQLEEPDTHHLYAANSFMLESQDEESKLVHCYIKDVNISKSDAPFRDDDEFIPPGSPTDAASDLRKYALEALMASFDDALTIISDEE